MDVFGEYIHLNHFSSVDKEMDESNTDGFYLFSKRGVTVHLSGENRDLWMKNLATVIKSVSKDAKEPSKEPKESDSLAIPKDPVVSKAKSKRRESDSSAASREDLELSGESVDSTTTSDKPATPKGSKLNKLLQATQTAAQPTVAPKATKQGPQTVYSLFCKGAVILLLAEIVKSQC